jgi:hypothetical protein
MFDIKRFHLLPRCSTTYHFPPPGVKVFVASREYFANRISDSEPQKRAGQRRCRQDVGLTAAAEIAMLTVSEAWIARQRTLVRGRPGYRMSADPGYAGGRPGAQARQCSAPERTADDDTCLSSGSARLRSTAESGSP